jgi:hypothetical protein
VALAGIRAGAKDAAHAHAVNAGVPCLGGFCADLDVHLNHFRRAASLKIYAIAPTTPREDRTKNIKELQTMATGPAVPTFKEALKNDQAEFDDCTPCRVIGTASLSSAPSPSSLQKVISTD